MEIFHRDGKKVLWEVVEDHVVEEETNHDEIGLRGLNFNFFNEDEKGVGREWSSEFTNLILLIKLWHGDWKTQTKRIYQKVEEDNGKAM